MIDPEVQILLDQKQDIILPGMPVPRDGQLGDLRTNVAHGGKFFQMMKGGEDNWLFSAPYTRTPQARLPAGDVGSGPLRGPISYIDFGTGLTAPLHKEGRIFYDDDEKTLAVYNNESDVTLQLGQETYIRATNKTGAQIDDGTLVYINGAQGNRPTIAKAKADVPATSMVISMATHDIANNATGFCTTFGLVHDIDTNAHVVGTTLYLSASTAGAFTATAPTEPNFAIQIGTVIVQNATTGVIMVNMGPTDVVGHMVIDSLAINDDFKVDTDTLFVDSGNNRVGIGTVTPDSLLHVSGPDPVIYIHDDESSSESALAFIKFVESDAGGNTEAAWRVGYNLRDFTIDFSADDNNGAGSYTNYFFIKDDNGFVGIGTAGPDAPLHIKGAAGDVFIEATTTTTTTLGDKDSRILMLNSSGTVGAGGEIVLGSVADSGTGRYVALGTHILQNAGGEARGDFYIATKSAAADAALTKRLTVLGTGNVGIGTVSPQELLAVAGDIVLPKASGAGIKVDNTTPTFGFADIIGDQFSKNTGASKPTLAIYNGAVQAWRFGDGDEAYMSFHIPHDHVPGTDIFLHIHWSQTYDSCTGGTIDMKYSAVYAKGHNQVSGSVFGPATPITATFSSIDINDGGSGLNQYQHHLTEVIISGASATGALFDRDDFEPDGVIEMTFEMVTNSLTGVAVTDPFIHFVDIHYQTTGLIGTKDKAPDFYA